MPSQSTIARDDSTRAAKLSAKSIKRSICVAVKLIPDCESIELGKKIEFQIFFEGESLERRFQGADWRELHVLHVSVN